MRTVKKRISFRIQRLDIECEKPWQTYETFFDDNDNSQERSAQLFTAAIKALFLRRKKKPEWQWQMTQLVVEETKTETVMEL